MAIGVVGDGDTRGQRHLEWGSTPAATAATAASVAAAPFCTVVVAVAMGGLLR
jgi:hypothetical protein